MPTCAATASRWLLTAVLCTISSGAWAQDSQDSRAATIADQQAQKATRLTPARPSRAEEIFLTVRRGLLEEPSGFYPYFDSVYSGGGFTLGAGYRRFTGDRTHWNVAGLYSAKSYKFIELGLSSPGHLSGRVDVRGSVGWRDATQVAYRGLGMDSPPELDTAFRMQQAYIGASATLRPSRFLRFTADAAYEDYQIKDPTGNLTSVDDVFTPETAPALDSDPTYIRTSASAAFDTRPGIDYARRGGLYQIGLHQYTDTGDVHSFTRVDTDLVQHFPILRETWVVSVRGRLQSVTDEADDVPFFLLPSLGSGSTLRAYGSWRFRDRHAALFSGEWRWIVSRMALDMAVFYDTGAVAPRVKAIARDRFASDVGVGIRFHGPTRTPLRVELAHGREGWNIVFAASGAF
jgi:outer membrane protein assembly factor BamA